jgi:hypothetical protein
MRQKPDEPGEAEEDGQEEMRVTTAGEKRLMVYGSKSVLFAALPLSGCTQEETTANSRGDLQVRTSRQFLPAQASRRDAALVAAPEDSADLSDSRRRGPRVRARRSDHRAGFGQAHWMLSFGLGLDEANIVLVDDDLNLLEGDAW